MAATCEIAVVTGGNKGIGYCVAKRLVDAGLRVIVACRNPELGQKAAAELGAEFASLDISSGESIDSFAQWASQNLGRINVLVNNAAIAFKAADPTPFQAQTEPTLGTNFYGTVRLTDALLPLLRAATGARKPRLVNVASMSGRLGQVQPPLQAQFASPTLTRQQLGALVAKFAADVQSGTLQQNGWGKSNYGLSKLAVIAYTNLVAREEGGSMVVNSCCPGWCATDMSSHGGRQSADDGAKTVAKCALLPDSGPSGAFFQNEAVSAW